MRDHKVTIACFPRKVGRSVAVALAVVAFLGVGHAELRGESHQSPAEYVNTLQGTNSRFELTRGNTFPATAMPFGMHMWTPQTGANGDGWKYQYFKDTIRGFQQSHQCSSWSNDYCVFSLMPVVGKAVVNEGARATKFRHEDEVARPHYYRVKLASGVIVEMAPTERGAMLRFTFPAEGEAHLVLDGYTGRCGVEVDAAGRRVVGWVRNGRLPHGLRNDYVIEFDQPFTADGVWDRDSETVAWAKSHHEGRGGGAVLRFAPGSVVQAKVASSYIDAAQAVATLQRELGGVEELEQVADLAKQTWDALLSKAAVEGGSDDQTATFYSCLYRASLFPHRFYEIGENGAPRYRSPYDGGLHDGYLFTDTGFWDTFRGQMPLHTLLIPTQHGRYLASLLDAYDQCGWLPSWSFPGEQGSMIGNHAISLLADGWFKGIRTFDPAKALEAYRHEATNKGPWGPANGRDGHEAYYELGYVPSPDVREATAKTLEYAYDDFCGYTLARENSQEKEKRFYLQTVFNYRNVYDPETGFMRGRQRSGDWTPGFDPIEWGGPYTEGCAWHWAWSVMHDIAGLIDLFGGDEAFVEKLDAVFTATNEFHVGSYGAPIHEMTEMKIAEMGQYAHGNQPIQHMPYLYCYAGQPWKTQFWVREIMDRLYNATENGYPGDEDQGQTSAWYVLSALGFYSVCPGTDEYVLGTPLFPKATIANEGGEPFVIEAPGVSSENRYIQSADLNGEPLSRNFLRHLEITSGGYLVLNMGPEPNRKRGVADEDRPFSLSRSAEFKNYQADKSEE
ncbi:Glycosyl hydrolase family 92 [Botrimarina colliarenosi]|uniref:Glycosyl hydrolase family 92 n=1 Tax=Botrimarina colliarenosi TaxID=2528001 RepID=A0A5C6AEU2_9BACT|nr:GH92 family glycosyl hydrolase [Botrimarina colliarenosi]TWT97838.1 Glycosyl hydrolase family 92 [Botrimarina colliarenosi]